MKKAESQKILGEPKKGRKQTKPKYYTPQYVDSYNKGEAHYLETRNVQFNLFFLKQFIIL